MDFMSLSLRCAGRKSTSWMRENRALSCFAFSPNGRFKIRFAAQLVSLMVFGICRCDVHHSHCREWKSKLPVAHRGSPAILYSGFSCSRRKPATGIVDIDASAFASLSSLWVKARWIVTVSTFESKSSQLSASPSLTRKPRPAQIKIVVA